MKDSGPDGSAHAHRADLALFVVYFLLYAGFMALTAFSPETLAIRVIGGVNLAVAYGMGLILAAVILAAVAMFTHAPKERP
jgi:uncharacterized membrane protein (DUF485 family)